MTAIRTYSALVVLTAAAVLALSACGGSDTGGAAAGAASAGQTVSTATVDGVGEVLVDSQGDALYSPDEETGGKVLCTGSCVSIWAPLTLPVGASPTAGADLRTKLGIVQRPDGAQQVTYDGKPLYRFVEDPGPGTVTGNDFSDSFDGKDFTWHVASPGSVSGGSTPAGGGYGY